MKRLLALVLCAFAFGAATTSCGGGDYDASTDKLTLVVATLLAGAATTSCGGGDESLDSATATDKLTIVGAGS